MITCFGVSRLVSLFMPGDALCVGGAKGDCSRRVCAPRVLARVMGTYRVLCCITPACGGGGDSGEGSVGDGGVGDWGKAVLYKVGA